MYKPDSLNQADCAEWVSAWIRHLRQMADAAERKMDEGEASIDVYKFIMTADNWLIRRYRHDLAVETNAEAGSGFFLSGIYTEHYGDPNDGFDEVLKR